MTSKYDRLADHLAALDAPVVTLTFGEIEAVVGSLPPAARRQARWWGTTANGCYNHPHAMHWWDAGYLADRPDFAAETVTFRRARSRDVKKVADRC